MSKLKSLCSIFVACIALMILATACSRGADIPPSEKEFVTWTGLSNFELPTWSLDGAKLALREYKYPEAVEHARLFLYIFKDNQSIPLTYTLGNYTSISWSPDNSKIVVAKENQRVFGKDIQVVDLDKQQITTISFGEGTAWAPNGQYIAIYIGPRTNTNRGQFDIQLVRPDGTPIKIITLPLSPTSTWIDDFDGMSWSPDSQEIAFSIRHVSSDNKITGDIYVVNTSTNAFRQLTSGGWNRNPAWSPGGKIIAYISMELTSIFGRVYLMGSDGSCPLLLSTSLAAQSLSWSPIGGQLVYEYGNGIYVLDTQKKLSSNVTHSSCP